MSIVSITMSVIIYMYNISIESLGFKDSNQVGETSLKDSNVDFIYIVEERCRISMFMFEFYVIARHL